MNNKSLAKNYIYNFILTTSNIIFPLITAPYLSSILGATNIGKVNYATSIINWFIIFASFGIPRYGIREIARNRDDRKKLSSSFWNLILIQVILSSIALCIYIVIILNSPLFKEEITLYLIMVTMILLNIFSIDWFYQGIEEYRYITIRNILFKVISIILIFAIIRDREDYLVYALLNIFALGFNNILNYLNSKKYVDNKIYEFKIFYYLKELKVYFFTTLIMAFYTSLDQIFIGAISPKDLAYYLRSKTVSGIGLNVVNSIITIFVPRTAYLVANNYSEYKSVVKSSINYIYILAIPGAIGTFVLAKEVMLLLGGVEFLPAASSLQIMSILIIVISIGGWQVNQILLPNKQEKLTFYIQCGGAALSVILNLILIPKLSYRGAAISWVACETILMITEYIFIRYKLKDIEIKYINKSLIKYIIASLFMLISILIIKTFIESYILIIFLSITISPIFYFIIIIILKDSLGTEILNEVIKRVKNK